MARSEKLPKWEQLNGRSYVSNHKHEYFGPEYVENAGAINSTTVEFAKTTFFRIKVDFTI